MSDNEVVVESEEIAELTFQQIYDFAFQYKVKVEGYHLKLWSQPIHFLNSLEKEKKGSNLEFITHEIKEVISEWMNEQANQAMPEDFPYLRSWIDYLELVSSRPSYTTSFPSEQIPISLEKLASNREKVMKKEMSAKNKQSTGCDNSEKNSKKRKVMKNDF